MSIWVEKYHKKLQSILICCLLVAWYIEFTLLFAVAIFAQILIVFLARQKLSQQFSQRSGTEPIKIESKKENLTLLTQENLLIKNILNEIKEGVVVVDKNAKVQFCNLAAQNIISHNIVGHLLTDIELPKVIKKAYKKSLQGEEIQIVWKKGSKPERQYYEITNLPSQREGFISIIRDITKVKRLERMKRDFIANVSHEIRTPIAIIQANTETLLDGAIHDEQFAVKFTKTIHRNTKRMAHLVEELLDLSKIESGEFHLDLQQYYLYPLVHNILKDLDDAIKKKNQEITVDIDMALQGYFDQSAMKQIITNYIVNAIKYTPIGSKISISTTNIENSEYILFSVKDNGQGIPTKYHPRIFERFFRVDKGRSREEGGTGLGLAIVKHLAHLMNCSVGVENNPEGGAHFWCQIPRGEFGSDTEELLQAMQKDIFHLYDD